jgi:hypothetical protein
MTFGAGGGLLRLIHNQHHISLKQIHLLGDGLASARVAPPCSPNLCRRAFPGAAAIR